MYNDYELESSKMIKMTHGVDGWIVRSQDLVDISYGKFLAFDSKEQ